MTTLDDRIRNPEFNNWVKSALTLDIARDALTEFVETKNKANHESLIQNISATCSSCDFNTCANCKNKTCTNKQLKKHIKISHFKQNPSFGNTSPKDCWSQPWEFAKCFMPPNGYRGTHTPDDTDFPGLISVIVNNFELREAISHDDWKFNQARDVRNEIMHNPGFAVDDQTFKHYIDVISTMIFCLPITDTKKVALSKIGELSRGTLTITAEDIASVIDKAIELLGRRNREIKDSIQEMSVLSERCKQEIKEKEEAGVKKIEHKTEEGVEILRDTTEHGLTDIKKETANATDQLSVKQKEVFDAFASKASEGTSQLHNLHKYSTFAFKKTAERECKEIQNKAEQEQKMLKRIVEDSIKKLDIDINLVWKKTIASENVRNEISQNADKIQRTTDTCVITVQDITHKCLESLYKQTDTFKTIIRDTKCSSRSIPVTEHDKRNEIESIRTEFSGQIQEVLREIRDLKSEKTQQTMAKAIAEPKTLSDEDPTRMCDPCKFEGVKTQGGTFCQVCSEYLCDVCKEVHRGFRATREHELKSIDVSKGTSIKQKAFISSAMKCTVHDAANTDATFVLMAKEKSKLDEGIEARDDIMKEIQPSKFEFHNSDQLETDDSISVDDSRICFHEISSVTGRDINIRSSHGVSGCVFMPDGRLVVCAGNAESVKVFSEDFKLKCEIRISSVWDVAVVSENQVIVSNKFDKSLQFLNISCDIAKGKTISVGMTCWGVDYKNDKIYVTCHDIEGYGATVKVLTMTGDTVSMFNVSRGNPHYLTVNNAGDRIVVSIDTNDVQCYDSTGATLYTYSNSQLSCSNGVLFDSYDNFMVCGYGSNNLHVVNSDGTKQTMLLSSRDGIDTPCCLAYRSSDRTLFIGQQSASSLVFKINYNVTPSKK